MRITHHPTYRLRRAASLLGVSDDTVRRWAEAGRLPTALDAEGHRVVEGTDLAALAGSLGSAPDERPVAAQSARNRFPGLVVRVLRGDVVSQVEIQAGPHRVVSLMTTESVDTLGLAPGVAAIASVKSTNVVIDIPEPSG